MFDQFRGMRFLMAQFGVPVEVAADIHQLRQQLGQQLIKSFDLIHTICIISLPASRGCGSMIPISEAGGEGIGGGEKPVGEGGYSLNGEAK